MLVGVVHLRKHPPAFYLNVSLWLVAAITLGFAIRSLALADAAPEDLPGRATAPLPDVPNPHGKSSRMIFRIYDVADLVDSAASFAGNSAPIRPSDTLVLNSTANNQQQNPQGGGGIGIGQRVTAAAPWTRTEETMDALVHLVEETILPDGWTSNGGTAASVSHVSHGLVVGGDAEVHREVVELLRKLREADAGWPAAKN